MPLQMPKEWPEQPSFEPVLAKLTCHEICPINSSQLGCLSKRKEIATLSIALHSPALTNLLFLPTAQLLQSLFVGMVCQESLAVRLQPSNDVAFERTPVPVVVDGIGLGLK